MRLAQLGIVAIAGVQQHHIATRTAAIRHRIAKLT
jgi:hypothetical protein